MSRRIDLNEFAKARSEVNGDPPIVAFRSDEFELPTECPWTVLEAIASDSAGSFVVAVKDLLGDGYGRFVNLRPSTEDMRSLVLAAPGAYLSEDTAGESGASDDASSSRSGRSKQTS